jgi:hypothetical protein
LTDEVARPERDDHQHQEIRQQRDARGELEDGTVGRARRDVLLLHELDAVGDQLSPAVEGARVHRS